MSLVTHLECSLTADRYEAGKIHNLSRAGKPLIVRYDLAAAAKTLTREALTGRGDAGRRLHRGDRRRGCPAPP